MILYLQCRSSISLRRFIELLESHGYDHVGALDDLGLLGLVISTNHKKSIGGAPREEDKTLYLAQVFELELMPSLASFEALLVEMFGHPSDA